jgi:tRNA (guanine-N7-)-methyltransferase
MARLRKAARVWRSRGARAAAEQVMVAADAVAFMLDLATLFDRSAPLEVELGAGRGDFIIERAAAHPERNFLAVELAGSVARLLAARAGRRELKNLRVLQADARTIVNLLMPDAAVAVYHLYFPDPWPKARHEKHRMMSRTMVAGIARTLIPGGMIQVASDVEQWAAAMFAMLCEGGFVRIGGETAGARFTGFARKYIAAGKPIFAASFRHF